MPHTLLKATELTWSVNQKPIVRYLNFSISTGETVAIVGPNGAGKTSFLKCIYGEHRDFSGSITLNNQPLSQLTNREIAQKVAVVSQHPESVFDLSVIDIVRMGLIPHKGLFDRDTAQDDNVISKALQRVDLSDKQHQLFNTLSGGEQQRVLIARAIVQSPDLLIMDEPTNHLDIYFQHQILVLAKALGITLLITIHDLNLAAQYCDRVVLMTNGEIVADDSPTAVFTQQRLTDTFKLPCHIDENPLTKTPRITFAGITFPQNETIEDINS